MNHTYQITGMTCEGCQKSVQEKLLSVPGVREVSVDLLMGEAHLTMDSHLPVASLKQALPDKYTISEQDFKKENSLADKELTQSKFKQLKPLFLIFAYLFVAAYLLNYDDWILAEAMLDFMGLFFIVFSFFKLLDLKGFPESFKMYDPLAKAVPIYALIYPFIELILGLLFLMRIQIDIALMTTLIILGITTFGVMKTLLNKKSIRCACLGTALNLPMTEATFIENAIMIAMAIGMLTIIT
jgi:copper chaperone CopZ